MNPLSGSSTESLDQILDQIKNWIQKQTGIQFTPEKMPILRSRLDSMCVRHGYKDLREIYSIIETGQNQKIIGQIIEAATTNHTHFYRETESLLYFQNEILPSLNQKEDIRIWSAAASSGEELYTLALLTVEKLGFSYTKNKISFLGTDVNQRVIDQAEKGLYNGQRISDLPDDYKKKWFKPVALGNYSISEDIKDLCIFRSLNLKRYPWPFTRTFHIVFLRNVLYYFDEKTQAEIVNHVYDVTQPGGWLITSVTENMGSYQTNWKKVKTGIYKK